MLEKGEQLRESPIRVVFVDDDPGVRRLVEILLGFEDFIDLVAEASNGTEAIELVKLHQPDILVTDYRLPDLDGIEVCNEVAKCCPKIQLLLISGYDATALEAQIEVAGLTFVDKTQAFVDFAGLVRRIVALRDVLPQPRTELE